LPAGEIYRILSDFFARYGYWTVAAGVVILPVPAETVLVFASIQAYSRHDLRLPCIILVGVAAAMAYDNAGYAAGRWGGRPLLERFRFAFRSSSQQFSFGERFLERHGSAAIFMARFIIGLRVVAGALAGVLRMRWRRFVVFDFLGSACWVTAVCLLGYAFAGQLSTLLRIVGRVNVYLLIALAVLVLLLLWRRRFPRI
jgi:membrane protein DedA with SNARE-associated domain